MEAIVSLLILVFVIVWATRIETGMNKLNETVSRIETHMQEEFKKGKK